MIRPFTSPRGILVSCVALALSASGCEIWSAPFDHSERHEVVEPVHLLVVDAEAGDVEVVGSSEPTVVVEADFYGEEVVLDRHLEGERLLLRARDDGCWSCRVELTVRVPAGTAVDVVTGSGDVSVLGVAGDGRIETGSGDVTVDTFGGEALSLQTGSGDIEARRLWAVDVLAEAGSGDVDLGFEGPPSRVRADTGSGDQHLTLPCAAYALDADTGSGDVRVDGIRLDDAAPRSLTLSTGSGDITVAGFTAP